MKKIGDAALDRLKLGMWSLFTVSVILPALYMFYAESVPAEIELPTLSTQKEHIWKQAIVPLPTNPEFDGEAAKIGKLLWFDAKVSANKEGLCESCHRLANNRPDVCFEVVSANCNSCHVSPIRGSGGDGGALYTKSDGSNGNRNTLSVWNSRFNVGYGWDGREFELGSFIKSHISDSNITGISKEAILENIGKSQKYKDLFKKQITVDTVAAALAEFAKSLVASNSRFDLYLAGEHSAVTELEKKGYETFRKKGCVICHNGINIGGNSFKTFGIYKMHKLSDKVGWFAMLDATFEDENLRRGDTGVFAITGAASDKYLFRVASLRNVELNRPYFTQGQVWELEDAIRTMGRVQLGVELTDDEVSSIRAFLGSISGRIPVIKPPLAEEY